MSIKQSKASLILFIGVGGAFGACSRYLVSLLTSSSDGGFPFTTLLVNLIGCFSLAYIANSNQIRNIIPAPILTVICTGFIGSFTTFSAFSVETVQLFNHGIGLALIYIILQLFGGILFCLAGYQLSINKGGV
ncbi:fluoride efflux transporter FluC [Aquibacillus rhizosphaerae]|uniref:Fluoride-specific ion channel FluC n=1 Tax=Aquibacillus rhizosphaerae TaxID=3051431 RepID=A0ABT7L5S6_9BACI|nr:CrcB family protein [Aquibacillus sp. LR5S19]MDL4839916.1 CrcB family protein [Aquibacillus sp. LR5S19]